MHGSSTEVPRRPRRKGKWAGLLLTLIGSHAAMAQPDAGLVGDAPPAISIIIDDLGGRLAAGLRAIRLPGPVACSFLPHSAHTRRLAQLAYSHNKEVLLHLPMQSVSRRPLDPGGLSLHMTQREFLRTLQGDLAAVPHASGINNHMGSLMTRHPGDMQWLMRELSRRGRLFFIDSRTTRATVAMQVALENRVPSMRRDVFLDNDRSPAAIRAQFEKLIAIAERHGTALGIGHPHPHTLEILEQLIPELHRRGIRLIPVARMLRIRQEGRQTWQASLSPSPKAARSLKR